MRRKRNGFTLIETLIAMVILSSSLVLLAQTWGSSFLKVRKTQVAYEVGALLERKMAEIELEYRGKPLDSIPDEKAEDFGSEYPQYSWKLKSKKLEFPDLSPLMQAKEGGADPMVTSLVKQLGEHLSKSIKEVTVTVVVKGGKKNQEFSVTTYFVDYDQPIAVSGAGG
jgi:general secretion pathway protein I